MEKLLQDEVLEEIDGSIIYLKTTNNNKQVVNFTVYADPGCCGINILGCLEFDNFEEEVRFFDLLAHIKKGRTITMTLNNNATCKRIAEVLPKCKNWVMVKKFINSNTNNPIEFWMSNND